MAYIGRDTDKISNVEVLDNITFDGSSSYTLQKNSVNFTPSSANTLLVSIDGVVQAGNFTVSGSTIDFGTAVAGTSTCDFILHYGVGLITTPADGTVTTAKLADSSVSLAKLTATGTKDATTFLRGDNTFDTPPLGGITMADQWRLSASANGLSGASNKISSNWERTDTDGYGTIGSAMTQSSGEFSFPATGIYLLTFKMNGKSTTASNNRYANGNIYTSTDSGSSVDIAARGAGSSAGNLWDFETTAIFIFDVTNTSTHKVQFGYEFESTTQIYGNTDDSQTCVTFIRLGDT
jgi:hypothetical protein